MAAEREGSALPASGLAVVIALMLGVVVYHELPLDKARPGKAEKSSDQLIDHQDAEARLWQDPFAAAQRHQEELAKLLGSVTSKAGTRGPEATWRKKQFEWAEAHRDRHRFKAFRGEIADAAKGELTIMGVMVSSAPYAEDLERRQRFRYATLAGLNRAGYVPVNGDHVGYVLTRWRDPDSRCSAVTKGKEDVDLLPELIPYEWFSGAPGKSLQGGEDRNIKRRILVLWLSEHAFSKKPVETIRELTHCLNLANVAGRHSVKLMGPQNSDTLRTLVESYAPREPLNGLQVQIYSPGATASSTALLEGLKDKRVPYCTRAGAASKDDICVLRTTATDDELARNLLVELEARGLKTPKTCNGKAGCKPDRIALISEWDTFYGRSLPGAISSMICPDKAGCSTIVHASYLQGIDGVIPADGGAPAPITPSAAKSENRDQTREAYRGERSDGRHQFDYLRRLALNLKQQNEEGGAGRIKAIGVLGSDVYDKLLVLRALRPEFPEVLFFTTDLDARLLHPQEFPHTRNIIVGSAFDLRLREPLQGEIPPFRDAYQTALFFSTLLAATPDAANAEQEKLTKLMKPRVFEIGRRNAFALDRDDDLEPSDNCTRSKPLSCPTLHPDAPPFVPFQSKSGWLYIPALLLLGAVAAPVYSAFRRRNGHNLDDRLDPVPGDKDAGIKKRIAPDVLQRILEHRRSSTLLAAAAAFVLLILAMHVFALTVLNSSINLEPLRFYEGISLWPTEALRMIAGLVAIFLTYWAILRMDSNHAELSVWFFPKCRRFGLPEFDFNQKTIRQAIRDNLNRETLRRIFACNLLEGQKFKSADDYINAEQFWRDCAYHSSPGVSAIRTFVAMAFFYAAGVTLMAILGFPHTPFRGDLSNYVDKFAVLIWSTPLLLFLTFYVADTTLLCKRFISALIERHTEWPPETREYFGAIEQTARRELRAPLERPERWWEKAWRAITFARRPPVTALATLGTAQNPLTVEEAYDDWIDIQLIAKRTAAVGGLVYYPVMVMMILLFARSSLFDNWHWPPGLIFVLSASMSVLVVCYIVLRREAEAARTAALSEVSRRLVAAKGDPAGGNRAAQLEVMRKNIEAMREGAFAPITQQPLVKALLIFFSASGLALLEYFGVISF